MKQIMATVVLAASTSVISSVAVAASSTGGYTMGSIGGTVTACGSPSGLCLNFLPDFRTIDFSFGTLNDIGATHVRFSTNPVEIPVEGGTASGGTPFLTFYDGNPFLPGVSLLAEFDLDPVTRGTADGDNADELFGTGVMKIGDGSADDTPWYWELSANTLQVGEQVVFSFSATSSPVPVPAAAWLFGSGLIGLVGVARRRTAAVA